MTHLSELIERIRRFSADCDPSFASAVDRVADVEAFPLTEPTGVGAPESILTTLAELQTQPESAQAVLGAIQSRREQLRWYPGPTTAPRHLVDRMAAAELVGPDGERHSDRDRLGVFVIEPDTDFPAHRHSASEFYAVVAGTATWDLDDEQLTLRPGGVIEIPSRAWHAIHTGRDPMLCCYLWRGHVEFDDYEFRAIE